MLATGGRRERNRIAVMMTKAEEEEKENVGAGAVGAVQGCRLLPFSRPQPLSDVEDYAARHHPHNYVPSFLPEILGNIKPSASNRGQSSIPSQSAPFWTYAAGHGGSVEHWKKLARKAELEMHLEQEQHKSDREKDLDSIHRLRCRISVLEAAAIDRDMMIEKQRRKICSLKSQLGGVNKRFGKEISILRNQSEQMQNRFSTVTGVSEKKILELKEELQHSESKTKLLENQLGFIYKCIEDPLEMFNLTELHERAPESVQQSPHIKSSRKSCKKQGATEADETAEGFDDFTTSKGDRQIVGKDMTGSSLMRKRQAKNSMAGKILQLRSENTFLSKQVGQRNERLKSLFHEAEHLRKQLKEAIAARNSALCQVRESERLFEKLEAMEPLIFKAGILTEQDLASICDDFSVDKGHKTVEGRPKDGTMMEGGGSTSADDVNVNCTRFPRKQAFKKWAIILSKIRSALLVFVSKVHATSQLESNLKSEKDSFNSLVQRLQREVLSELDSKSLDSMVEMERLQGEDQIDLGKDVEGHTKSVKIDKELIQKILTAVRAQKKKLLVTTGRLEDLKKEKISSEANLFNKQKKISELEKRLSVSETDKEKLSALITSLHCMLAHIDTSSMSKEQKSEKRPTDSNSLSHMGGGLDSLATQLTEAADIETVVKKVEGVLNEREEFRGKVTEMQTQNMKLCEELANLHNVIRLVGVSDHDLLASNEDLGSQLKQFKARKDELEMFYEESVTWHRSITRNLWILQGILSEGMVYNNKKLPGLDYAISKAADKSLLQDSFKQIVCCIPDMVLKVNLLSLDQKEFDSKLRNAELKRKEAESEVIKQSQLLDVSTGLQKELDEAKKMLKDIYSSVSADSIAVSETESVGSNILEKVHRMIERMQQISKENAEWKQKVEGLKGDIFSTQEVLLEALVLVKSLRQDITEEAPEESQIGVSKKLQIENRRDISENECAKGIGGDSDSSLSTLLHQLKSCLEEVQSLRKTERIHILNEASSLKQELNKANEQLEKHVKRSLNTSIDYSEKMQALSEEIAVMKAERESLLSEVSASSTQICDLQRAIQELQHHGNAQIAALQGEKEGLTAELKKANLQSQEQLFLYEQSRKELTNAVEALKTELSSLNSENSGSKDTAEELRRLIIEGKAVHEQALKDWEIKKHTLEEESKKLQHELNQLVVEMQTLKSKLKEKELTVESLTKAGIQQAEDFKLELARASHEQAGSGNEISKLQTLLKERELAAAEAGSQLSHYSKRMEGLSKENTNLQQERLKLEKQLTQLQQAMNDNDSLHKSKLKLLTAEVYRLGGPDVTDDNEKSRRRTAAERVKEYLARGVFVDTLVKSEIKGKESLLNPLRKLAVFQVDLLVNTKANKQLEVGGITGGLTQAAIHYFTINQQVGEITFETGNPPGSQSSNMLAELMLLSGNNSPIYETNAGDVLGLAVKVKGLNDKNPREILYNTSVIRTDEVGAGMHQVAFPFQEHLPRDKRAIAGSCHQARNVICDHKQHHRLLSVLQIFTQVSLPPCALRSTCTALFV